MSVIWVGESFHRSLLTGMDKDLTRAIVIYSAAAASHRILRGNGTQAVRTRSDTPRDSEPQRSTPSLKTIALIASLVAILAMVAFTVRELTENAITIEPFSVPESLSKHGYDGTTLALRLIDSVGHLSRVARTKLPRKQYTATWQQGELDLTIPEIGTNLRVVLAAVRHVLRMEQPRFSRSISEPDDEHLEVVARLAGVDAFQKRYGRQDIPMIIEDLSRYYYSSTQPIVLADHDCGSQESTSNDSCRALLRQILNQPPRLETFYALNLRGLSEQLQSPKDAIRSFTEAIAFQCPAGSCKVPDSVRGAAWSNRGLAKLQVGEIAAAISDMKQGAALAPADAEILTNLGIALTQSGSVTEARQALSHAIEIDPAYAPGFLVRGRLHVIVGELGDGLSDISAAIRLDPLNVQAYSSRAAIESQLGDLRAAARDNARAEEISQSGRVPVLVGTPGSATVRF
jgi:hypothetical protein